MVQAQAHFPLDAIDHCSSKRTQETMVQAQAHFPLDAIDHCSSKRTQETMYASLDEKPDGCSRVAAFALVEGKRTARVLQQILRLV